MAKAKAKVEEVIEEEIHIGPVTIDYEDGHLIAKIEVKPFALKGVDYISSKLGPVGVFIGAGLRKALEA